MKTDTLARAREVLEEFGLTESPEGVARPTSGHRSSVLVPCEGGNGQGFLLKLFEPPALGRFYPPEIRFEDFARREVAFYRFLETYDPDRRALSAPKSIMIDPKDPPEWILLERIVGAVGPAQELISMENIFDLLDSLQSIPVESVIGRRNFPLNRWDTVSFVDRMRMFYDPLLFVVGEERWRRSVRFFEEALRWTETRKKVIVHGDFAESNLLVDPDGMPFLVDFERIGTGSEDHDLAWFWIHNSHSPDWKRELLRRWFVRFHGSDRIRAEWAIRASIVYEASRNLRFGYLTSGELDPHKNAGLALLDAALRGGPDFFPN
jgi:aminoglycoside phosphotransferase (APT) family kinase protein